MSLRIMTGTTHADGRVDLSSDFHVTAYESGVIDDVPEALALGPQWIQHFCKPAVRSGDSSRASKLGDIPVVGGSI